MKKALMCAMAILMGTNALHSSSCMINDGWKLTTAALAVSAGLLSCGCWYFYKRQAPRPLEKVNQSHTANNAITLSDAMRDGEVKIMPQEGEQYYIFDTTIHDDAQVGPMLQVVILEDGTMSVTVCPQGMKEATLFEVMVVDKDGVPSYTEGLLDGYPRADSN